MPGAFLFETRFETRGRNGHDDLGAAGGAAAGRANITRTRSLGLVTAVVAHWCRVIVFERLSRS